MQQLETTISHHGLEHLGLATPRLVRWNLPPTALVQAALVRGEATLVAEGALSATTGPHTGRSPNDRFIVDEPGVRDTIDWGKVNRPIDAAHAGRLWAKARAHVADRELFVQDCTSAPRRSTAGGCAWSPRTPGTACSPATCSANARRRSWPISSRISRSFSYPA